MLVGRKINGVGWSVSYIEIVNKDISWGETERQIKTSSRKKKLTGSQQGKRHEIEFQPLGIAVAACLNMEGISFQ